jgi:hypothetical protein
MIVICVGDSYTDGTELWEEQNVPEYCLMTPDIARSNMVYNPTTDVLRKDLTYTGFMKKMRTDWSIHNFGKGGASQQMITENMFNNFVRIRMEYPNEKIVCVMQDTFRNRMTFCSSQKYQLEGLNVDKIDIHTKHYPETSELVSYIKKFIDEETLATQFYSQAFIMRDFFKKLNIPFLNFSFYNHAYTYRFDMSEKIRAMKSEYIKTIDIFPTGALQRAYDYYRIKEKDAVLPSWHLKGRYHEIIANDLVDYIEDKFL